MRTTLTLEEEVATRVKAEARRTGKAVKVIVNDALKRGLGMQGHARPAPRFSVTPHTFGFRPGVDLDRLNHLVDELDTEAAAQRVIR